MRTLLSLICAAAAAFATTACSEGFAASDIFERSADVAYVEPPVEPRSTWAEKILSDGKIPDRGFLVAYFNRSHSSPKFHIEEVDSVAVKYAWSDLHNIRSQDFAAYWIGQVDYEKAGNRTIGVNEGWARSRIFINGREVYSSQGRQSKKEFTHYFTAGTHLIEVEYINNWHTTEYKVSIVEEQEPPISDEELRSRLARLGGSDIVYVSLYESANQDTSVEVTLPRYKEPVVVWLDSYEGVDWTVDAPGGVSAYVIASHAPATRIMGDVDAPVYRSRSRIRLRSTGGTSGCSCTSGHFHCEYRSEAGLLEDVVREKSGRTLIGFGADYSASRLSVNRYQASDRDKALANARRIEEARKACVGEANPDFDTMLDGASPASPANRTSDWGEGNEPPRPIQTQPATSDWGSN